MHYPSATLNVMGSAAEKAARAIRRDFTELENLQVSLKGTDNFVTSSDVRTQATIHDELARARPGYGFLMEEGGSDRGDGENLWIIDPIDGTANFMRGIPHFAISIALARQGEVVAGFVLDPIKHETYWAEKGRGAFVNGQRARVSPRQSLAGATVGLGIPHRARGGHALYLRRLGRIMAEARSLRRLGAASLDLCYVACGKFDAYWETGLSPWDIAAGRLAVTEAGGIVSGIGPDEDPLRTGGIVAGTPGAHDALQEVLRAET